MKIEYKTGDIFEGPEKHIAHGCNAQGVMRSGIAAQIVAKHPYAFECYRKLYESQGNRLELGQAIWVPSNGRMIINLITQEFYGRDPNRRYVSYEAVRKGIRNINANAHFAQRIESMAKVTGRVETVAFPLIGAGLANGSWNVISGIIEEEATNFQPVVYLYDGIMPTS